MELECRYCKQAVMEPCRNDAQFLTCNTKVLANTPKYITCSECGTNYAPGERHACTPRIRLERDALLVERQKTHGSFETNAAISQRLKSVMYDMGTKPSNSIHCEALEMIALKLSRICSGQSTFKDHWDDIAGYAKLGSEACD